MTDAGQRLIEDLRDPRFSNDCACEMCTDFREGVAHQAIAEIERLRATIVSLISRSPVTPKAIAASRSTGAADMGEEALTDSQGRDLTNAPEEYRREASGERDR